MTNNQLYKQITLLPTDLKAQVFSYISLLKRKASLKTEVKERTFGYAKDFFKMTDDFDQPLEDFKDHI